jgi:hypothetical protein
LIMRQVVNAPVWFLSVRAWPILLVGTLLTQYVGCSEAPPPELTIFSPESGAYTCDLPGKPTVTSETLSTPAGAIEVKAYTVTKADVEYAAKDAEVPKGVTPDKILDAVRSEIVKSSNGKLLNENKISLGDVPSRELTIELSEGRYAHIRLYLVKGRLFQTVVTVKSPYVSPVAAKFFASIKWQKSTTEAK